MDGMNPNFSTDQWIQHYPNSPMAQSGGHEPSEPATATPVHKDSSHGTPGQSGGKPIRRRSRASRKTPTTLLNASPTDFRALVQRFTGCDSGANAALPSSSAPSVVNLPKGPLNIDFGRSDVNESSSRYDYFNGQMRASSLPIGDFQGGYDGMENANSVIYEPIDESSSFMATGRDGGGSHGY